MPGIYAADRGAAPGRAGLALPFTPTTGPIRFQADARTFRNVEMYDHYSGTAGEVAGGGIRTHSISSCAVFGAAEWTGATWGNIYFAHIQGGDWTGTHASFAGGITTARARRFLEDFADETDLHRCYCFILVPRDVGYDEFAKYPQSLGFREELLSVYITNTSGNLGCAVEFRTMGEFGELDTPASQGGGDPYGVRSTIGRFANWY